MSLDPLKNQFSHTKYQSIQNTNTLLQSIKDIILKITGAKVEIKLHSTTLIVYCTSSTAAAELNYCKLDIIKKIQQKTTQNIENIYIKVRKN